MSCLAAGFPAPVIGWLKDNESIDSFSSVSGGNSSLALRFVERQDTNAKYRCIARNSLGKTYSSEATLTVLTRQATRGKNSTTTPSFNYVIEQQWSKADKYVENLMRQRLHCYSISVADRSDLLLIVHTGVPSDTLAGNSSCDFPRLRSHDFIS